MFCASPVRIICDPELAELEPVVDCIFPLDVEPVPVLAAIMHFEKQWHDEWLSQRRQLHSLLLPQRSNVICLQ